LPARAGTISVRASTAASMKGSTWLVPMCDMT
jgi:hypothetical protein